MTAHASDHDSTPTRAIGYQRVSTRDQADSGAGLEVQRQQITAAADYRGWELLEILEDAALSGKNTDRPALQKCLRLLGNKDADALIVKDISRLARNALDFAIIVKTAKAQGWRLVLLDLGGGEIDTGTPTGKLIASIMAELYEFERAKLSERTKEALAIKRAQGVILGRPRVLPDEVCERICVERWVKLRKVTAIADGLNVDQVPTARGLGVWRHPSVAKVLESRYGQEWLARHEASV